jgi:glyceraldehyde-3-phosphate dehydrogenase/erythrose-4-phosphate dehydrogenase
VFGVDIVIDATGKYREAAAMEDHMRNGAPRVMLRTLPLDHIDRIVVPGVNETSISPGDRMISGASGTTTALNVPIHEGCMADVNLMFEDTSITAEQVNEVMRESVRGYSSRVCDLLARLGQW